MKQEDVQILIQKYLNAETTSKEEEILALEVSRDDAPTEWKIIAEMLGELALDEALYNKMMAERKCAPRIVKMWPWLVAASVAALLVVFLAPPKENTTTIPFVVKVEPKIQTGLNINKSNETVETKHLVSVGKGSQKKRNIASVTKTTSNTLAEQIAPSDTETEANEEMAFEDNIEAELHDDLKEQMQMCDIECFNNKISRKGKVLTASIQEKI